MVDLFSSLSSYLYSSAYLAITAAFIWGVLSIVLSPCHLASIPLIVAFIDDRGEKSTSRAAILALSFSAGILITILIIGAVTGLMGKMFGDIGIRVDILSSIIFIAIGLYFLELIRIPFIERGFNQPKITKKGIIPAFLLGLIFGITLGPCTFAFMAPVLGAAFFAASDGLVFPFFLVSSYAVGHCFLIVLAGSFSGFIQGYLDWDEKSRGTIMIKKICGGILVIIGIYFALNSLL